MASASQPSNAGITKPATFSHTPASTGTSRAASTSPSATSAHSAGRFRCATTTSSAWLSLARATRVITANSTRWTNKATTTPSPASSAAATRVCHLSAIWRRFVID